MTTAPIAASAAGNNEIAYRYFVTKGLKSYQSAGVVGNLMQESGSPINPRAVQPGGPGRGIAQWSVGDRWDNLLSYASQRGQDPYALNLQLDFIWYELTSNSANGLASLRSATDVTSATYAFMSKFERCGQCESASRVRYAQQILSQYGGGPAAPTSETALPTLRSGSSGTAVTTAQYLLRAKGYSVSVDGAFGPGTQSAVTALQRARGLSADGVLGPNTWAVLLPTLASGSKGEAVKALQVELNAHGAKLVTDGDYGSGTKAAVVTYQKAQQLASDGIVGPATWGSLID